ncbi:ABC transporter ATP-binding protein [Amphritea atlantica]|uniref:ABC transporter ATP-binding protein n=1 Tax=Amphritea atlantica TaxID=355243 RepID=A0ABY5GXS6_9GAMM|nr:ABC transporter ATP-binding protein [Amphritea atlantica]
MMLEVNSLSAYYGLFQALFDVDLRVEEGECISLIGANGAGKTTLMRTLVGALKVDSASVLFEGRPVGGQSERQQLARGVTLVPEGRRLFPSLTVRENIELAQHHGRPGKWDTELLFQELPALAELQNRMSTELSGGQQQLVAISRALVTNPRLLLCDEISLGLSPYAVDEVYRLLNRARKDGMSVVLVEQNVQRALAEADRFYCIQKGRVVLDGPAADADHHAVANAYFGV